MAKQIPRRPKTEAQLAEATKQAATRGYLSQGAWEQLRKSMTTSTGWNTAQFDAWFAKQVDQGTVKVTAGNRAAGTAAKRKVTADTILFANNACPTVLLTL